MAQRECLIIRTIWTAVQYHDALYELMRLGLLDRKYRDVADRLLRRVCIEHDMDPFWADQFYNFVHALGEGRTFPDKHPKGQIIEIP